MRFFSSLVRPDESTGAVMRWVHRIWVFFWLTVLGVGIAALLLPGAQVFALAGLVLVGLGCAPIYPSVIHSTPAHFGVQNSQAVIGIQMASAYVGNLVMPPLFGLLANNITPALFPFYLLVLLVLMVFMHEQLVRKTSH